MTVEQLIQIPTEEEIPTELRNEGPKIKPVFPQIKKENIPEAIGWRLIILPPKMPNTTEGGVALIKSTIATIEPMNCIGIVLAIGPMAFSHEFRRWPEDYHPIKVGDYVNFHPNAGIPSFMDDDDGNLTKIKILADNEIWGKPKNIKPFMTVV